MLIKAKKNLLESALTPESVYSERRTILKGLGLGSLLLAGPSQAGFFSKEAPVEVPAAAKRHALQYQKTSPASPLVLTPESKILTHNNFYEFGTGKTDPFKNSQGLELEPWTLSVEGEVAKPGKLDVWELINGAQKQGAQLEERIYRMRCVEAWSMVIPWIGIELGQILKQFEPTSKAKYLAFETLYDPEQMPGQQSRRIGGGIDYPYVEGLRMDEAMHPLTILSVGLYGKTLAPQNGAPIRLVVPWKYGFKGIKSIVKIRLVEKMPPTTWNMLAAKEYGFYANVNPAVDHPRWSQGSERVITEGGLFSAKRQKTLPFNGYADEVAGLYSNMNLKQWY
ncbi:MAG: protein-methionine-sulfoxide reductase catalytic subunit MsrP [Porticoccaceae bacterium]|nr:protein-methionine-sulfoxide reductase catalytic subunit MsrP [Porticoccaceae bacterium]